MHPLVYLLHIYSPYYGRDLRVMDFFLSIYLSFYLSLFPYYYFKNDKINESMENRSLYDRYKKLDELFVIDIWEVK
jgi:hypothetical protein